MPVLSITALTANDQKRPPAHSTGSRLVQNTFFNIAGQVSIAVLTFVSTPYIVHKMGSTQYGALSLLMTYLFAFSLLNLGINASLVKYMAELMPRGKMDEIQQYFSTSLTVLMGIGILIGVTVQALAPHIVRWGFRGSRELAASSVLALKVASMAFILQFLTQVLSAAPAAAHRFDIINIVRTGTETLRIAGTMWLLSTGRGLPEIMGMILLSSLVGCVAFGAASKRLLPSLSLVPGLSRRHLRKLVQHSRFIVLTNASNQAVSAADAFLIGCFLPVANVAYYGIAYTLAQRMWSFTANMVSVVFPAASAVACAERREDLTELYIRALKAGAACGCFPAVALCAMGDRLLDLWLGPEYAGHGSVVLVMLSLGFLINSFSYVTGQVLQGTHHAGFTAKSSLAYMTLNIALFLLLIPAFGILGASSGFLIAQLLFVPWFIGKANRLLGASWREIVRLAFGPVFICAGASAMVCRSLASQVHSFFSLALVLAAAFAIYVVLAFRLALDSRDRAAGRLLWERWTAR